MGLKPVANTGNTFNGIIEEFPGLGADRFNICSKVFLLSHCHSDHLCGLKNKSFDSIVYCSETTKVLLSLDSTYQHVLPYIKTVKMNSPFMFTLDGKEITLTLIEAYHCPGSTMFLIESEQKNVLYTGDLRAESWWVETLPKIPFLFPYTIGLKVFDNIYLDTTFTYRGEPFIEIPLNNEGIAVVTLLISSYPQDDPDIQFYFGDSTSGFEEAWVQIVNSLKGRIHMNDRNMKRIELLRSDRSHPYTSLLNQLIIDSVSNINAAKFHACGKYVDSCSYDVPQFPVRIKQCIEFNILDYTGVFCPILMSDLSNHERMNEMKMINRTRKGNTIYEFRGRKWLYPEGGKELLPAEIKLVFSRHSSYSECRNFLSKFKFREVHPCTDSETSWKNGITMTRLFGDLAFGKPKGETKDEILFEYDKYIMKSNSMLPFLDRPIRTINRWNFSQCAKEVVMVKEYLTHNETKANKIGLDNHNSTKLPFKFRGQQLISKLDVSDYSKDEKMFNKERQNDTQLLKVIIGRNDTWYRKLIDDQQRLYSKYHDDIKGGIENVLNLHTTDTEFRDGAKLGGLDRYNYDVESILDDSSDNLVYCNTQHSFNDNERDEISYSSIEHKKQLDDSKRNLDYESTDTEDAENDNTLSENKRTHYDQTKPKTHSAHKEPTVKTTRKSSSKHRPCLKRRNNGNHLKIRRVGYSFIESTFSSFEASMKWLHFETEMNNVPARESSGKTPSLKWCSPKLSSSKIYLKSNADIDSAKIQSISNKLNSDPAHWFGLELRSVNTPSDKISDVS